MASHSLARLADAGHNLVDVLGLAAAWGASILSNHQPSGKYTCGLRHSSVLAALGNALVLPVVTGAIIWEGIRRLLDPEPTARVTIVVVAAIGILVNGVTVALFMSGRKGDMNVRGAFLHMASDVLVAFGVVAASGLILWTGWHWLDPAIILIISVVIVAGTWSLLRGSRDLSLDGVPDGIDKSKVERILLGLPEVDEAHDLHIWGLSTTETALTAHLVGSDVDGDANLLNHPCNELREHFEIAHATFHFESPAMADVCELRSGEVV